MQTTQQLKTNILKLLKVNIYKGQKMNLASIMGQDLEALTDML